MNWLESLCELYQKNEKIAGVYMKGRFDEDLILVPIYHSTLIAHITVFLDTAGEFINAKRVLKGEGLTIIPVTEASAIRTSNCAPHPLCDGLKYLAGDYGVYCGADGKKNTREFYKEYMAVLKAWKESQYSHPKLDAIYEYLQKGNLIRDLVSCGCLILGENGLLSATDKLGTTAQADAMVRFIIAEEKTAVQASMEEKEYPDDEKCWKDLSLQKQYIKYCRWQDEASLHERSYATGEMVRVTYNNPKKIRNDADSGKLISFNDQAKKNHFLFEGLFPDANSSLHLGYEELQMAYNALKWVIRKQGTTFGDLCTVFYIGGEGDVIPSFAAGTEDIMKQYSNLVAEPGEGVSELQEYEIVQRDAEQFTKAMQGYGKLLSPNEKMHFLAFKAATPGRLAIVENHTIYTGDYLKRIEEWHRAISWLQRGYEGNYFYGSYNLKNIARILYGEDKDKSGRLTLKGKNVSMEQRITERLIGCILFGDPLPEDIVNRAVHLASRPQSYSKWYNWEQILSFACACIKKKWIEKNREECGVELRKDCTDRNYLYGRLLAIADRMEYRSFKQGESRETNAKKYMTAFSIHPFRTWMIIEQKVRYCQKKLKKTEALYYQKQIAEIMSLFRPGDYESQERLDGMYLMGFYNEATELQRYTLKNKGEEEHE